MRRRAARFLALSVVSGLLGCGAGSATSRDPNRPLPSYTGHASDLFDDAIEPAAVGYELDRADVPMNSSALRERAEVGDAVVRARVTTITSKEEDRGNTWHIGFHTLQRLAGGGPLDDDFTLQVNPNGAASGILRAFEGRLVGKTFVAYVREYAAAPLPGESYLHFHLARDDKDQAAAVRAAVMVDRKR